MGSVFLLAAPKLVDNEMMAQLIVPVYTVVVCLSVMGYMVNSGNSDTKFRIYQSVKKKPAEKVKDTRPWQERFGGVWESKPSMSTKFDEACAYNFMPYIKKFMAVKIDVGLVREVKFTDGCAQHFRLFAKPSPATWKFDRALKYGTCADDAEEGEFWHDEDNCSYKCKIWYDAEKDELWEQYLTLGTKKEHRSYTNRCFMTENGQMCMEIRLWRERDNSSFTFHSTHNLITKYGPSLASSCK